MANLDALTGVRRHRLRDGLWSAAEGVVYEAFRPEIHVVDNAPVPAAWPRFWSIDFGFTNPFVLQCWAEDPDGRLILYREIYQTQRTVDLHAKRIMEIVAPGGAWIEPKPSVVVCDHDAGDRVMFSRTTGLSTVAAKKDVDLGIQAVQRRFALRKDGTHGLALMRDAVVDRDALLVDAKKPASTLEEVPGYIWDRGTGKVVKETPLKRDDHGCDAMRYLVVQKDLRGRPTVRYVG
jgi:phage terminase large subunit